MPTGEGFVECLELQPSLKGRQYLERYGQEMEEGKQGHVKQGDVYSSLPYYKLTLYARGDFTVKCIKHGARCLTYKVIKKYNCCFEEVWLKDEVL